MTSIDNSRAIAALEDACIARVKINSPGGCPFASLVDAMLELAGPDTRSGDIKDHDARRLFRGRQARSFLEKLDQRTEAGYHLVDVWYPLFEAICEAWSVAEGSELDSFARAILSFDTRLADVNANKADVGRFCSTLDGYFGYQYSFDRVSRLIGTSPEDEAPGRLLTGLLIGLVKKEPRRLIELLRSA